MSSVVTKKDGKTYPIATPIGWAAVPIVVAITRSFSPNQSADSFAGAHEINGYPSAAMI